MEDGQDMDGVGLRPVTAVDRRDCLRSLLDMVVRIGPMLCAGGAAVTGLVAHGGTLASGVLAALAVA